MDTDIVTTTNDLTKVNQSFAEYRISNRVSGHEIVHSVQTVNSTLRTTMENGFSTAAAERGALSSSIARASSKAESQTNLLAFYVEANVSKLDAQILVNKMNREMLEAAATHNFSVVEATLEEVQERSARQHVLSRQNVHDVCPGLSLAARQTHAQRRRSNASVSMESQTPTVVVTARCTSVRSATLDTP